MKKIKIITALLIFISFLVEANQYNGFLSDKYLLIKVTDCNNKNLIYSSFLTEDQTYGTYGDTTGCIKIHRIIFNNHSFVKCEIGAFGYYDKCLKIPSSAIGQIDTLRVHLHPIYQEQYCITDFEILCVD